ncbi:succinylglutamate desuccinylase/aspartoacylase domain-containing protein [Ottowia caeni]|uniref:succinylglutamate desuccinylase/aspartoacylase domain-containing protein n=1 Tax=Ottowia caeni TaxID=2870339 RepID=UPI001E4F7226|nr:succinylglutamate desuccinylase/aspartoacylase family protein [Ottowia caeni]
MTEPIFQLQKPDISTWRAGNTDTEGVWHFESGVPGRRVMVTSLIHGNELCGAWAVKGLLDAGVRPRQGSLTLAFCNLAAFDQFDPEAFDASRSVDEDLNRQWSTDRMANAGSSERRRARELLPFVERADWLLDLHSMHEPGEPLLLVGTHARNIELARRLRSPEHVVVDEGHKDGTRMRDFGRFGLTDTEAGETRSLLVECGFHGDPASLRVARDISARFLVEAQILDAVTSSNALQGWRCADVSQQRLLRVTDGVTVRSKNFSFLDSYRNLEVIPKAGTPIGNDNGKIVTTPYDDCVLVMPSLRQARPGVTVVRFARDECL